MKWKTDKWFRKQSTTVQVGIKSSHRVLTASLTGCGDQSPKMALYLTGPHSRDGEPLCSRDPGRVLGLATKVTFLDYQAQVLRGWHLPLFFLEVHTHRKSLTPSRKERPCAQKVETISVSWAQPSPQLNAAADSALANTAGGWIPATPQNCAK